MVGRYIKCEFGRIGSITNSTLLGGAVPGCRSDQQHVVRRYCLFRLMKACGGTPAMRKALLLRAYWAITACLFTGVIILCYLKFNVEHTGHLTGMPRAANAEGMASFAKMALGAGVREGQAALVLLLVAAGARVVWGGRCARSPVVTCGRWTDSQVLTCALTGAGYYGAICAMRLFTQFDDFGYRLLYPGTFLLTVSVVTEVFRRMRVDARATFDQLPKRGVCLGLLILVSVGPFAVEFEGVARRLADVGTPHAKPSYATLEASVRERFRSVPPGSVVLVKGYLSDDYLAGFIRPDLVVLPYHHDAYGEQVRFPTAQSRLFVERSLAAKQPQNAGAGRRGEVSTEPFVEVARDGLEVTR